jgi:hypothetical protein
VGGWCPRQANGAIKVNEDIYYYYFRARGSQWYIEFSTKDMGYAEDDKKAMEFFDNVIFKYGDRNYREWPECGYLSGRECIKLANKGIKKFIRSLEINKYV